MQIAADQEAHRVLDQLASRRPAPRRPSATRRSMPRSMRVRRLLVVHQIPMLTVPRLIGHTRVDPEREPPGSRFSPDRLRRGRCRAPTSRPQGYRRGMRYRPLGRLRSRRLRRRSRRQQLRAAARPRRHPRGGRRRARRRASPSSTPPTSTATRAGARPCSARCSKGRRDEVVLATKFGMDMRRRATVPTGAPAARAATSGSRSRRRCAGCRPTGSTSTSPPAGRRHAARGDPRRARRARARGQGALRRLVELRTPGRSRTPTRSRRHAGIEPLHQRAERLLAARPRRWSAS